MSWDKFIFKIFLTFKLLIFFNFLSKIAKRWSNPTTFILILIIGHNKPPKVICLKLFPKSHSSPFFKFHFNRIPIRLIRFHSFIWARNWDWSLLFRAQSKLIIECAGCWGLRFLPWILKTTALMQEINFILFLVIETDQ
jgi:hypothetical protein